MNTFGDRLKYLLESKSITAYAISKKTEVSESTISRAINNKTSPSRNTITSICNALGEVSDVFTTVEIDWVRSGEGIKPGFESKKYHSAENDIDFIIEAEAFHRLEEDGVSYTANGMEFRKLSNGQYEITAPLVEDYAYAGYPSGFKDKEYLEELPKHRFTVDRIKQGIYRSFRVRGDSMCDGSRDSICEGDIVGGRQLHPELWKNKLHIQDYPDFVIYHHDGIVVKRIVDHDVKNGILYCLSLNSNKELYPNTYYRLTEVYELYNVVSQEIKRRR